MNEKDPLDATNQRIGTDDISARYRILRTLGNGTFASVVLAHDNTRNELVAMKMISLHGKPNTYQRVRREVQIHRLLNTTSYHPSVLPLHEMRVMGDDFAILVLEYASGGTLSEFAKRKRECMTEEVIQCLAVQMCSVLAHMHKKGLVHRDIKPSNVLFRGSDVADGILLSDFGLSRSLLDSTTSGQMTICGSPSYMAPEILSGGTYDSRCDMWSLGILLYETIMGVPAFHAQTPRALLKKIKALDNRMPNLMVDIVSEAGRKIINRLLHPVREHRMTAEEMLESEWLKIHIKNSACRRHICNSLPFIAKDNLSCVPPQMKTDNRKISIISNNPTTTTNIVQEQYDIIAHSDLSDVMQPALSDGRESQYDSVPDGEHHCGVSSPRANNCTLHSVTNAHEENARNIKKLRHEDFSTMPLSASAKQSQSHQSPRSEMTRLLDFPATTTSKVPMIVVVSKMDASRQTISPPREKSLNVSQCPVSDKSNASRISGYLNNASTIPSVSGIGPVSASTAEVLAYVDSSLNRYRGKVEEKEQKVTGWLQSFFDYLPGSLKNSAPIISSLLPTFVPPSPTEMTHPLLLGTVGKITTTASIEETSKLGQGIDAAALQLCSPSDEQGVVTKGVRSLLPQKFDANATNPPVHREVITIELDAGGGDGIPNLRGSRPLNEDNYPTNVQDTTPRVTQAKSLASLEKQMLEYEEHRAVDSNVGGSLKSDVKDTRIRTVVGQSQALHRQKLLAVSDARMEAVTKLSVAFITTYMPPQLYQMLCTSPKELDKLGKLHNINRLPIWASILRPKKVVWSTKMHHGHVVIHKDLEDRILIGDTSISLSLHAFKRRQPDSKTPSWDEEILRKLRITAPNSI